MMLLALGLFLTVLGWITKNLVIWLVILVVIGLIAFFRVSPDKEPEHTGEPPAGEPPP